MNNTYNSTIYEQYRLNVEKSIASYELPNGTFERFFLGDSFMHHPIFAYRLGTGSSKFLLTGGVHGRESINSFALLCMLNHYTSHFTCYHDWFTSHSLYILPMLNPDGYLLSLSEPTWKNNGRNVDLNRNFPCKLWKKKWNTDQPLSEPESQILANFFQFTNPDYYFDIHSRGKGIYYYRNMMSDSYNRIQKEIASKIASYINYQLFEPSEEINAGDSGGNTVQYFSEMYQKPALTIETVPDEAEFPISMSYLSDVFSDLVDFLFLF